MMRFPGSKISLIILFGCVCGGLGYWMSETRTTLDPIANATENSLSTGSLNSELTATALPGKQADASDARPTAELESAVTPVHQDAKPDPRKTYYPNTEELGPNEMRVISLGTGMPNQRKSQASACWLVELGNGDKFLFDLGTGSVANLSVLEIPYDLVNKVFLGHLHSDHAGDFAAWHIGGWVGGRQKAPRIWGPNGPKDHPNWGTKYFVDHQIKFVFSSDTFPNKWFVEHGKNADVIIHETFGTIRQNIDLQGWDRANSALVSARVHTPPAAAGKVFSELKPRMAIAYHFFNDIDTFQEIYDEIRTTYDGPITLAKDLMCWNVTDDGIKVREVVAQEAVWPAKSPFGTVPPTGDREELPPWLVDGIFEMEDVIKAYYERQDVGDLYEEQVPKK
jgi:ribonuclease Z